MAKQSLNLGAAANDNTGDTLRAGGGKINDNFTELYTTLANGADINSRDPHYDNATPLMLATIHGNVEIVQFLLEQSDVKKTDEKKIDGLWIEDFV